MDSAIIVIFLIIIPVINLIRLPVKRKMMGVRIGLDEHDIPENYLDYIGYGLLIFQIFGLIIGSEINYVLTALGISLIVQRYSMRKHAALCGVYEKGLILENGVVFWNKIHSIKIIDGNRATILNIKGIAFDVQPKYKINLLEETFMKHKNDLYT